MLPVQHKDVVKETLVCFTPSPSLLPILQQKLESLDFRWLVAEPTRRRVERHAGGWAPYSSPGFYRLLCQCAAGRVVLPLS